MPVRRAVFSFLQVFCRWDIRAYGLHTVDMSHVHKEIPSSFVCPSIQDIGSKEIEFINYSGINSE